MLLHLRGMAPTLFLSLAAQCTCAHGGPAHAPRRTLKIKPNYTTREAESDLFHPCWLRISNLWVAIMRETDVYYSRDIYVTSSLRIPLIRNVLYAPWTTKSRNQIKRFTAFARVPPTDRRAGGQTGRHIIQYRPVNVGVPTLSKNVMFRGELFYC